MPYRLCKSTELCITASRQSHRQLPAAIAGHWSTLFTALIRLLCQVVHYRWDISTDLLHNDSLHAACTGFCDKDTLP